MSYLYIFFGHKKKLYDNNLLSLSRSIIFSLPTTSIAAKSRKNSTLMRHRSGVEKFSSISALQVEVRVIKTTILNLQWDQPCVTYQHDENINETIKKNSWYTMELTPTISYFFKNHN